MRRGTAARCGPSEKMLVRSAQPLSFLLVPVCVASGCPSSHSSHHEGRASQVLSGTWRPALSENHQLRVSSPDRLLDERPGLISVHMCSAARNVGFREGFEWLVDVLK